MILSCNHISKSYGVDTILDDCSFFVNDGEKAAIVGNNGAGKSTIMKIIMGELSADNGTITLGKNKTIGYLAQYQDLASHNSIYDEVKSVKADIINMEKKLVEYEKAMSGVSGDELHKLMENYTNLEHRFQLLNGYSYKSEIEGVIKGLGFTEDDFNREVGTLSGGQKTRVALCKLLLEKPDIIMLDEPTNHLDLTSIKWLETYLSNYNGAVLIIAHDRYFLDKIVTKVIEIENTHCHVYDGNYSDFSVKKKQLRQAQLNLYLKQQSEIKHQEEVIAKLRSYKQEKFYKRAESREKALANMERIDKPEELKDGMNIKLEPDCISGNDVLTVEGLSKSFDNLHLFSDISFEIKRGEHVALIGDNGTGKTTILKIINDIISADAGTVKLGTNVHIGYYDQEHHNLEDSNTLFEEIANAYPDMTNTKIRNTLAAFMFTGDDVFKLVKDLSGGEKGRLSLAKLMLSEANLIILDEPTNHLDLNAIEWLEKILKDYKKAFILISHDVYFLDNVVNRIFEIEGKTLKTYNGNYTDFTIQKEAYLSGAVKAFDKEQDKLRKMEEFIRRYKAGVKSKQARGREKILNRMEKMENPVITTKKIKLKFETDTTSVDLVLRIKDLAKSFDGKEIFSNLNLDIYRGDRIGVIGKNGVGKSTLLKIINGMEKQSKGEFKIGDRVKIGYYDQNHQGLDPKKTVLEELMYHFVLSEEEARNICGGFLFTEDDVYKEISSLSGGEKARVAFMKLMLEKPNFLILDEPTNHLDIYSREILSESLEDYTGTILVVSHDRNFLDCVVNNIYEVKKDGAELFKGDYNSYLNQREEVKEKDTKASLNFEEQKRNKNRISSLEKKILKAEADVEKLEEKKSAKEEEYNKAGIENNVDKLIEIQKELEELDMEILSLMGEWEELENELKTLKNTF